MIFSSIYDDVFGGKIIKYVDVYNKKYYRNYYCYVYLSNILY